MGGKGSNEVLRGHSSGARFVSAEGGGSKESPPPAPRGDHHIIFIPASEEKEAVEDACRRGGDGV